MPCRPQPVNLVWYLVLDEQGYPYRGHKITGMWIVPGETVNGFRQLVKMEEKIVLWDIANPVLLGVYENRSRFNSGDELDKDDLVDSLGHAETDPIIIWVPCARIRCFREYNNINHSTNLYKPLYECELVSAALQIRDEIVGEVTHRYELPCRESGEITLWKIIEANKGQKGVDWIHRTATGEFELQLDLEEQLTKLKRGDQISRTELCSLFIGQEAVMECVATILDLYIKRPRAVRRLLIHPLVFEFSKCVSWLFPSRFGSTLYPLPQERLDALEWSLKMLATSITRKFTIIGKSHPTIGDVLEARKGKKGVTWEVRRRGSGSRRGIPERNISDLFCEVDWEWINAINELALKARLDLRSVARFIKPGIRGVVSDYFCMLQR